MKRDILHVKDLLKVIAVMGREVFKAGREVRYLVCFRSLREDIFVLVTLKILKPVTDGIVHGGQ